MNSNKTRPAAVCCRAGLVLLLAGCGPATKPVVRTDAAESKEYRAALSRLVEMNRQSSAAFQAGDQDKAAKIMAEEKPLVQKVLGIPRPTLEAEEAASDLDQLYGTMLLKNRHYGWARILFQGNLARWRHWRPETAESLRRVKQAEVGIAECDRHIAE